MVDQTPETNTVVWTLRRHLDNTGTIRRLLRDRPIDFEVLYRLVARVGFPAAGALLDALELEDDRTARWRLFEMLAQLGPDVGNAVMARLPGSPWYVQRNLLLLMARLETWPKDFTALPYAKHPDPRVRREAYALLLRDPATRAESIALAVADSDERIVRAALNAALEGGCPREAVRRVDGATGPALARWNDGGARDSRDRAGSPAGRARRAGQVGAVEEAHVVFRTQARAQEPANARRAVGARVDLGAGAAGDEGVVARGARSGFRGAERDSVARPVSSAVSSPVKYLSSLAQSLSTMMLYPREHPTWGRAVDASYQHLVELQKENPHPAVLVHRHGRDLRSDADARHEGLAVGGEAGGRGRAAARVRRGVTREEYEEFLADVLTRIVQSGAGATVASRRRTRRGGTASSSAR